MCDSTVSSNISFELPLVIRCSSKVKKHPYDSHHQMQVMRGSKSDRPREIPIVAMLQVEGNHRHQWMPCVYSLSCHLT